MDQKNAIETEIVNPESYRYGDNLPADSVMLQELLKATEIRQLFDACYNLITIPMAIIDRDANVLLSSRWQRICTEFHRIHPTTCRYCLESDRELANQLQEGKTYSIHSCQNGLTDCASPIIIEGKCIANLFIGQFLTRQPDETWFRRQAEQCGFEVADYLAALREVPVVGTEKVPVILDFLTRLTRVITSLSMERKRAIELQARQAIILNTIPQSVFWKDIHGRYLGCNAAFARSAGVATPGEIVGKTDFDLPWPRKEAEAYRADDQAVIAANERRLHIVEPLQQADGSRIFIDTTKLPLVDAANIPYGVVGVYEDITERKRMEEALCESEARYRKMFQSNQAVMIIVDPDTTTIVDANPAACAYYGWSREELLTKSITEINTLPPEEVVAEINLARAEKRNHFFFRHRRADGSIRDVEIYSGPLETEGKALLISIVHDITDRRQAEAALRANADLLKRILESTSGGVWDWNIQSGDAVFSPGYSRMLGYDPAEFATHYKSWKGLVHPDDVERVKQHHSDHFAGRTDFSIEFRMREKSGEWHWIHSRGLLVERDAEGKPLRMIGTHTDIQERKLAAEELAQRNRELQLASERLALATAAARIGVWDWDVPKNELVWDDSMYAIYGLRREDFNGAYEAWSRHIHPDDQARTEAEIQAALRGEHDYAPEFRIIWPDGSVRHLKADSRTIRAPDGKPLRMVGTNLDITERKLAEQDRVARQVAEKANQTKSDFLANMSHELRTPLNAIIGMTHLALKTELTPKQQDYLTKVKIAADALLRIINEVLDFSTIEDGKLLIETVDFSLNAVLHNTLDRIAMKAEDKGLKLRISRDPGAPDELRGDPMRLGQVLAILANNAVKFTEKGEISVAVQLEARTDSHVRLRFSVRDTGIGMSAEQRAVLFQPFTQADTSSTRKYGGTGLGLSISKRLTELMDGKIWVDSTPGNGSTFTFTAMVEIGKPAKGEFPLPSAGLRGAQILLVEDNEINQLVAREMLEQAGLVVTIANHGQEAVDALKQTSYDAVLMDVQMPVMDGYSATRAIRKWEQEDSGFGLEGSGLAANSEFGTQNLKPAHPDTRPDAVPIASSGTHPPPGPRHRLPIIAMTAHAMAGDAEKSRAAGMDDHVTKPIDPERLFAVLGKWVKPRPGLGGVAPVTGAQAVPGARQSAVSGEAAMPPQLPGIDIADGLRRIGGNKELYRKILRKLCGDYADARAEIDRLIAANQTEDARRLAHSIKGVAGNIGAKELQAAAGQVEAAIRDGVTDDLASRLADFAARLAVVVQGIAQLDVAKEQPPAVVAGPVAVANRDQMLAVLRAIEPHLRARKPKPAKEAMEAVRALAWPGDLTGAMAALDKMVEKYQFKEALAALEALLERLR